jgi:CheY-like chemotaxis protein
MLAKIKNPTKVLLVDDEPDLNKAFKFMLERSGFEVQSTLSVDEALDVLEIWPPDILLSDYHMPEKNGGDLLTALREQFPMLEDKMDFFFLTGSIGDVQNDSRCNGVRIIEKPVRLRVLKDTLLSLRSSG